MTRGGLYYDRQGRPVGVDEAMRLLDGDRGVARTAVVVDGEHVLVSTVHLVLNHSWQPGPPVIFETMVFGGPLDDYCERYSTAEAALAGHDQVLARLQHEHGATVSGAQPWPREAPHGE